MNERIKPSLPVSPTMADFQAYVHGLESFHGWLDVGLVKNCFLMGEEMGELFKAIRSHLKLFEENVEHDGRHDVAEEIVDVLNYLLAIANRLDIDVEQAFRAKNERNLNRTWS
ncbi:MAG: MazG nucleotide pyrophosphohydrolase domain-containing protein [Myxococcota bacterium]|nr:MazG nucleotide pyrophosphohydrolase domain-containing protein [Myxococcota bacterium]